MIAINVHRPWYQGQCTDPSVRHRPWYQAQCTDPGIRHSAQTLVSGTDPGIRHSAQTIALCRDFMQRPVHPSFGRVKTIVDG